MVKVKKDFGSHKLGNLGEWEKSEQLHLRLVLGLGVCDHHPQLILFDFGNSLFLLHLV